MRKIQSILAAATLLPIGAGAATISLTAADINGGDTTRTSFTSADGFLTITPTVVGVTAPTFNANAARFGTDPTGTSNGNAFNDPNTTIGDDGDEGFTLAFASNAGLTSFGFDFSRANVDADGNGGVQIAGFLADPGAVFSGQTAPSAGTTSLGSSFNAATGVLTIDIPIGFFTGSDSIVNLNPATSAGQTLVVTVNDTTTAGAQLAVTTVAYDDDVVAVPEPSSAVLIGLVGFGVLLRRRR